MVNRKSHVTLGYNPLDTAAAPRFHSPVTEKPVKPTHLFHPRSPSYLSTYPNIYHSYSKRVYITYSVRSLTKKTNQRGLDQPTVISLHARGTGHVIMAINLTGNGDLTPDI